MISLIAAIGKNRELGINNQLLWNLKDDMKYFKETTTNHTIVMGRKTYESIGGALPNRRNIVMTRNQIMDNNIETVSDIKDILNIAKKEEIFIIGGGSIYKQFLPYANKLYLTIIDDTKKADTYFPHFNEKEFTKKIIDTKTEDNINYSFVIYEKNN